MVADGIGAPLDEGHDQFAVSGQEHLQERHRIDLSAMRDRQLDDVRLVHKQRTVEHVVLDLLALFMA
jgi:hypothetical protein